MFHIFDERLVIDKEKQSNIIYNEHLVRYEFASKLVVGKIALDIACGSGYGSKILAEAGATKVIAMDVSQLAINDAQKNFQHNNIEYKVGDATNTGLEKGSIDLVVSMETIEHLSDIDAFLQELERVVKDEGLVIISTPNIKVSKCKNPFHLKEFNKEEFVDILKKYFQHCVIIGQYNAIASYLKINDNKEGEVELINHIEPEFFLAVCSKKELPALSVKNIGSLNALALKNLYNNFGFKSFNKIYSILVKIPGMKKFIEIFK